MTQSQPYIEKESEPPLEPAGRGVVVTMPEGHFRIASATPETPFPAGEVAHKSETYLEISQFNPLAIIVPLAALAGVGIGLAGVFFMVYIYLLHQQEGGLVFGGVLFGLLISAYFFRILVGSGDRPDHVRFCRKSGKVYRMTCHVPGDARGNVYTPTTWHYRLETFDWKNIRGEIVRGITSSGRSASIVFQLQLAVLDDAGQEVVYRFPVSAPESVIGHRRIQLWEAIGRYMTDGPDTIPPVIRVPAMRGRSLMQCIERLNPFLVAEYWPKHGDSWLIKSLLFFLAVPSLFIFAPTQWAIDRIYSKPDWSLAPAEEFAESPNDPHALEAARVEREYVEFREATKDEHRKQNRKFFGWIALLITVWLVNGNL